MKEKSKTPSGQFRLSLLVLGAKVDYVLCNTTSDSFFTSIYSARQKYWLI